MPLRPPQWAVRGLAVCHMHGGATRPSLATGRTRALARAVARLGGLREIHPLDALLEAVSTPAAMVTGPRELVKGLGAGLDRCGRRRLAPDARGPAKGELLREATPRLERLTVPRLRLRVCRGARTSSASGTQTGGGA